MADVKIVDIDGEQWNIKDQESRKKIAMIEEDISTQDLPDVHITMKDGYICSSVDVINHYKAGKIHFVTFQIYNLSGDNIGTLRTAPVASTNLIPKKSTTFIVRDYVSHVTARCTIEQDGTINVSESDGISSGSNAIVGELIFAEP